VASQRETRKGHSGGNAKGERRRPWPRAVRLAAARAVVEQGLSAHAVAPRFGVPYTTLLEWSRKYREGGETRLVPAGGRRAPQSGVASASRRSAIVAAKRAQPSAGRTSSGVNIKTEARKFIKGSGKVLGPVGAVLRGGAIAYDLATDPEYQRDEAFADFFGIASAQ